MMPNSSIAPRLLPCSLIPPSTCPYATAYNRRNAADLAYSDDVHMGAKARVHSKEVCSLVAIIQQVRLFYRIYYFTPYDFGVSLSSSLVYARRMW